MPIDEFSACSIKTFAWWWSLAEIAQIYALIVKLDKRFTQPEDMQFYASNTLRPLNVCWIF